MFTVSHTCHAQNTSSTLHLGDKGTETIRPGDKTGCLKSRNYPEPYEPSLFDEVVLPVEGKTTLYVIIDHLEVRAWRGRL